MPWISKQADIIGGGWVQSPFGAKAWQTLTDREDVAYIWGVLSCAVSSLNILCSGFVAKTLKEGFCDFFPLVPIQE